jgi:hypothetical protein
LPRADDLADQHGARGPFAAETDALADAGDQQLVEVRGEAAKAGEGRVPQDGDLHDPHPAVAVAQHAAEPAADRRRDQRGGAQHAGVGAGDAPGGHQRRDQEAEQLQVHRVHGPAAVAAPERLLLSAGKLLVPGQHVSTPKRFLI